jgi:ubiquinone/menaquinone biosynthesis C-methylase UbiE
MNERTYHGGADRLRAKERVELLEVDRVVQSVCTGTELHSMLDVGTGTGLFAGAFAHTGMAVAGVDISEDMLAHARRFVPAGDFRIGTMEKIPFEDKSFDVVFLGHVLHEADDVSAALVEAKRVAKKWVAVLEWPYAEEDKGPPLAHRLRSEDVIAGAQKAGFAKVNNIRLKHMEFYLMDVSYSINAGDSNV